MSARDLRRRGRGRRDDRLRAEPARGVGEAEVVGTEVVAPLRDAVRLVDDEQPDRHLAQRLEEARRGEALGRDVEQPQLAGARALQHRAVLVGVALGVDERDASRRAPLQRLDLVLHQRDERRDDDREVAGAAAPAAGSRATCRRRSASRRARRGLRARRGPPPPGRGGSSSKPKMSRRARRGSSITSRRAGAGAPVRHPQGTHAPGASQRVRAGCAASGGGASGSGGAPLQHPHPAEDAVADAARTPAAPIGEASSVAVVAPASRRAAQALAHELAAEAAAARLPEASRRTRRRSRRRRRGTRRTRPARRPAARRAAAADRR